MFLCSSAIPKKRLKEWSSRSESLKSLVLQPLTMSWMELLDDWLQGGSGGRNGKVDSQILQVYGQSWIQQVHL